MMTLVIGTPDSGKSRHAEVLAADSGCTHKYYLATMKVRDAAGKKRVEKHRAQREGKGFITIEIPYAVDEILKEIKDPKDAVVLLECTSNLVGNAMHDDPKLSTLCSRESADPEAFTEGILQRIRRLQTGVKELIIVTNEFPWEDTYDEETKMYIDLCDLLNRKLRAIADRVRDLRRDPEGRDSNV